MEYITYSEYLKYSSILQIAEQEMEYRISEPQENKKYNQEELKEINKKHDKMFRNILSIKKEMVNFLNQFLNIKEKIKEEQFIQCSTDFITKHYQDKHSDIIYKLKNKPIYFLVEHQSTIDKEMLERIGEYVGEIMRKERKKDKYPIVVPIVIYTGFQNWNVKTNLAQKQYHSDRYKDYKINLKYNLVTIQDYTFEELLEKKTLFSSIMIMEKCEKTEELIIQTDKIIEVMKDTKDREILTEIITNIIAPRVGKEQASKMLGKIREKEEVKIMSPLTKMLLDLKAEGKAEGILSTAKKMLQRKMEIREIEEITGIPKEELEKLAKSET